jgi:hypothetical protein
MVPLPLPPALREKRSRRATLSEELADFPGKAAKKFLEL